MGGLGSGALDIGESLNSRIDQFRSGRHSFCTHLVVADQTLCDMLPLLQTVQLDSNDGSRAHAEKGGRRSQSQL